MNGIIIVDKPSGWTSQDVCSKLRGVLRERRIGHSGTLDPMATGVLPVFVGRATRAVEFAESHQKRYLAGLRTGIVTDTEDTTGTVLEESIERVSREELLRVLPRFTGEISQIPPMYSAVKIGGRKLYEIARRGETVERAPRTVTISDLRLIGMSGDDFLLDVTCSKGTYIRTLCHDIGMALGCGAAMSSLRRVAAGPFSEKDSLPLDRIISLADDGRTDEFLRPVDSLFAGFEAVTVDGRQERLCRNGNDFSISLPTPGRYRVYSEQGEFLMLGQYSGGTMRTVKSFFAVTPDR